jgi:hypothetical protein
MTNPYDAAGPDRGLDPAGDPDRFVPDEPVEPAGPVAGGPLDMSQDPDRYDPRLDRPGGSDLTELIGKDRAFEEERNPYLWVAGLVAVFGFLALASLVLANLSPR